MSRRAAAAISTGRKNVAYRKSRDAGNLAAIRAVARARPINSAGAQAIARKVVKSQLNTTQEEKFFCTAAVGTNCDDTNAICYSLCDVPQSTTAATDTTRSGDQIRLKNFEFRLSGVTGSLGDCHMRVILFQFTQQDQASLPTRVSVLNDGLNSGVATVENFPYTHDYIRGKTVRILADWRFPVSNSTGNPNRQYTLFFKTKKMRRLIQFAGGTSYGKNKIFLWYGSTAPNAGAGTTKPQFAWQSQINFTDS